MVKHILSVRLPILILTFHPLTSLVTHTVWNMRCLLNKITGLSSYRPFVFLFKPVMHTQKHAHSYRRAHTRTLILLPHNMCSTSKLSRVQRVRLQRLYSPSLLSHQLNFKQGRFIVNGDFCNFFVSHSAVSKQVDILECHFSEVIWSKMRRQKRSRCCW